jgi:Carbohydrate esterase, sialic acid-specific acetylesterase
MEIGKASTILHFCFCQLPPLKLCEIEISATTKRLLVPLLLLLQLQTVSAEPYFLFAGQSNMIGRSYIERFDQIMEILVNGTVQNSLKAHAIAAILNLTPRAPPEVSLSQAEQLIALANQGLMTSAVQRALEDVHCTMYNLLRPAVEIPIITVGPAAMSPYAGLGRPYGPELTFSHALANTSLYKNQPFSIVKVVAGGTQLHKDWSSAGGKYWNDTNAIIHSLDATKDEWKGIVWFQGESDAFDAADASNYLTNLTHFINDLRRLIHTANKANTNSSSYRDIPVAIIECGFWVANRTPFGQTVIQAQRDFVANDNYAILVKTDDLARYSHYDEASPLIIGSRIVEAYVPLLQRAAGITTQVPTEIPTSTLTTELSEESATHSMSTTYKPTTAPIMAPTMAPFEEPTSAPTTESSIAPTKTPTETPTSSLTAESSEEYAAIPSFTPTYKRMNAPIMAPTMAPSENPTSAPTKSPTTQRPTKRPSETLIASPTTGPTVEPTASPSMSPTTGKPTIAPTQAPTKAPTELPTAAPTKAPTNLPTEKPTIAPTQAPTKVPTAAPTKAPTKMPTNPPTKSPTTKAPTTKAPTISPTTLIPTTAPSESSSPSTTPKQCTNDYSIFLHQSIQQDENTVFCNINADCADFPVADGETACCLHPQCLCGSPNKSYRQGVQCVDFNV